MVTRELGGHPFEEDRCRCLNVVLEQSDRIRQLRPDLDVHGLQTDAKWLIVTRMHTAVYCVEAEK